MSLHNTGSAVFKTSQFNHGCMPFFSSLGVLVETGFSNGLWPAFVCLWVFVICMCRTSRASWKTSFALKCGSTMICLAASPRTLQVFRKLFRPTSHQTCTLNKCPKICWRAKFQDVGRYVHMYSGATMTT